MRDALKNYLTLASGLTEVGRQRAMAASKALVAQGEATAEQVGSLAEDLVQTSKNNRDLITALVRSEVEKALSTVGLATADSVERLTKRLQSLESALRDASKADDAPGAGPATEGAPARATSEGAAAKTAAKRVAAKSSAAAAARGTEAAKKSTAQKPVKVAKPAAAAKKSGGTAAAKPAKKAAKKASS